MVSIAKKIKKALIERDMTQADLCKKMNYNEGNLSKMLNRDTYKTDFLEQIAKNLGYEMEITFIDKQTGEKI